MSWLLSSLVGKAEEDQEGEEEKPSREGGVRNDLSQLGSSFSSFSRQLKGFSSFLTGDDEEDDIDGDEVDEDDENGAGHEKGREEDGDGAGVEGGAVDAGLEGTQPSGDQVDAGGNVAVPLTPKTDEVAPRNFEESEGAQPQLRGVHTGVHGVRYDLAALSGTMRNQLSRFSSVIRVVTGEDIAKPSPMEGGDEAEETAAEDRQPLLPFLELGYPPVGGGAPGDVANISGSGDLEVVEEEEEASILQAAAEDIHALRAGISKFASNLHGLLPFTFQETEREAVGVNDDVIALATNLAAHPETWTDFPLPLEEGLDASFTLSAAQEEHLEAVEYAVPRLAALRSALCPEQMSEDRFLLIYFLLLHTRLQPQEAQALSTEQVVEARRKVLQVLQDRAEQQEQEELTAEDEEEGEEDKEEGEGERGEEEQAEEEEEEEGKMMEKERKEEAGVVEEGVGKVEKEEVGEVDEEKEVMEIEEEKKVMEGEEEKEVIEGEEEESEADEWLEEVGEEEEVSFSDLEEDVGGAGKAGAPLAAPLPAPKHERKGRGWVQLSAHADKDAEGGEDGSSTDSSSAARGSGSEKTDDWLAIEGEDAAVEGKGQQ